MSTTHHPDDPAQGGAVSWHLVREDAQRAAAAEFPPRARALTSDLVVIKNRNGEWASPDNIWAIPGGLDSSSERTGAVAIEE